MSTMEEGLATGEIEEVQVDIAHVEIEHQPTSDSWLFGEDLHDFVELEARYKSLKKELEGALSKVKKLSTSMVRKIQFNAGLGVTAGHLLFYYAKPSFQTKDYTTQLELLLIGLIMIALLVYWALKNYSQVITQFESIMVNARMEGIGFDGAVEDLARFFERMEKREGVIVDLTQHSIKVPALYREKITSIKYSAIVDWELMRGDLTCQAISAGIKMCLAVMAGVLFWDHIKMR